METLDVTAVNIVCPFDAPNSGNIPVNNRIQIISPQSPQLHFRRYNLCKFPNSFVRKQEHTHTQRSQDPKTDFNAKWPFKFIYFSVSEKPLTKGLIHIEI